MPTQTHSEWCPLKGRTHTDAARKVSDTYNLHRVALGFNANGKWFAVRLSDGTGDDVLYDRKIEAVRHQKHNEKHYAFLRIMAPSMTACEAEVMLSTHRRMYDAGMRMVDPDHKHGGPDLITRLTAEDQLAMMRGVVQNLRMPWEAN